MHVAAIEPDTGVHEDREVRRIAQGIVSSLNTQEHKAYRPILWPAGRNSESD